MTVSRKVWRRLIGKVFRVARRQMKLHPAPGDLFACAHWEKHSEKTVTLCIYITRDHTGAVTYWSVEAKKYVPYEVPLSASGGPYVRQGLDEMFDDGRPDWETRMVLARCRNALEHALLPGRRRELQ